MRNRILLFVCSMLFACLGFAQTNPTSVVVTFTASVTTPASNIGYNIYRGTSSGTEVLISPLTSPNGVTCAGTACTYTDTLNLVLGTRYFYYVRTVDLTTKEMSPPSSPEATCQFGNAPPVTPAAPTNVAATPK